MPSFPMRPQHRATPRNGGSGDVAPSDIALADLVKPELLAVVMPNAGQSSPTDSRNGHRVRTVRVLAYLHAAKWEPLATGVFFEWRDAPPEARPDSLWILHVSPVPEGSGEDGTGTDDAVVGNPIAVPRSLSVRNSHPAPVGILQVMRRSGGTKPSAASGKLKASPFPPLIAGTAANLSDEDYSVIDVCRRELVEQGLETPPFGEILIQIEERCVIGPVELRECPDGRWRASAGEYDVRSHRTFGTHTRSVKIGTQSVTIYSRASPLPSITGRVDFGEDDAVFAEAIRLIAGGEPERDDATSTRRMFDLFNEGDRLRGTLGKKPLDGYRMWRFKMALDTLREDVRQQEAFRAAILTSVAAKEVIAEAKSEAVRHAEVDLQEARKQLGREQESVRCAEERNSILKKQIAESERCLLTLEQETRHARETLSEAAAERTAAIASRVAATMVERVGASLVERVMALIPVPVLTPLKMDSPDVIRRSCPVTVPWKASNVPASRSVLDSLATLKAGLKNAGFDASVASPLLASWLAGLIPVIVSRDEEAAFARAIRMSLTGGRSVSVHAGAVSSFGELFGRVIPAERSYVPHHDMLADAVLTLGGGEDSGFAVATFAGAAMSEANALFAPLMAAWNDPAERLPLVHPSALDRDNTYYPLCTSTWPDRLLPVIWFAESAFPIPASPSFWRGASLIRPRRGGSAHPGDTLPPLPPGEWTRLRAGAATAGSGTDTAKVTRLRTALRSLGVSDVESDRHVFLCHSLPLALAAGGPEPTRPPDVTDDDVASVKAGIC